MKPLLSLLTASILFVACNSHQQVKQPYKSEYTGKTLELDTTVEFREDSNIDKAILEYWTIPDSSRDKVLE